MVRRFYSKSLASLAGVCLFALPAASSQGSVVNTSEGTGPDSAQVIFNFPSGFVANYTDSYTSATGNIDGYDLTQISASDPNLTLSWTNYGTTTPNYFLNNATYAGGGTSVGFSYSATTPQNYWHEYYNNGSGWVFGSGASNDTIDNGGEIGWVYGSSALPISVPEPASLSLISVGSVMLLRRPKAKL